jgi:hypothetical protein
MRQNAVSSAPQNDVPIQMLAIPAAIPRLVEKSRRPWSRSVRVAEVRQDAALDFLALQYPAGHEQRQERHRQQRQQQVVGDHRGEAGEVVLVGLPEEMLHRGPAPAAAQVVARFAAVTCGHRTRRRGRVAAPPTARHGNSPASSLDS